MMQQCKVCNNADFLTLTYDTEHVPITKNGFMSLSTRHVQLFFKKLRWYHPTGSLPIKYYVAGEYGSQYWRPHYHIILFNADLANVEPAWSDEDGVSRGLVSFDGPVSEACIGYTLKYICKPRRVPVHANDDRLPERGWMSKGLGLSYLNDEVVSWHYADLYNRMYVNLGGGRKLSMPRYYRNKLYSQAEQEEIAERAKCKLMDELILKRQADPDFDRNEAERVKMLYRRMEMQAMARKL